MRKNINYTQFDEERALYHLKHADILKCDFSGEADGESALKECRDITVKKCNFELRYPLWHTDKFSVENSVMTDTARAAIWYCKEGKITHSKLGGIKAVRECEDITLQNCNIVSPEFGWKSKNLILSDCEIESEYFMLDSKDLTLNKVNFKGKYSFQYVKNALITDSVFHTKDAFWHSKNITVKNTVLMGEYLGWYSDGLTLENCLISGTQPLCYCTNLKLINCRTDNCDLAFEYSDVDATVAGRIDSVKNVRSGRIVADEIGEIIRSGAVMKCTAEIITKK